MFWHRGPLSHGFFMLFSTQGFAWVFSWLFLTHASSSEGTKHQEVMQIRGFLWPMCQARWELAHGCAGMLPGRQSSTWTQPPAAPSVLDYIQCLLLPPDPLHIQVCNLLHATSAGGNGEAGLFPWIQKKANREKVN